MNIQKIDDYLEVSQLRMTFTLKPDTGIQVTCRATIGAPKIYEKNTKVMLTTPYALIAGQSSSTILFTGIYYY